MSRTLTPEQIELALPESKPDISRAVDLSSTYYATKPEAPRESSSGRASGLCPSTVMVAAIFLVYEHTWPVASHVRGSSSSDSSELRVVFRAGDRPRTVITYRWVMTR
jgi:hypothetical protein